MTASKSLPTRPSLECLRKQAKKLHRDMAAGDADAIARARAHLPNVHLPLTQRNAQLVIAREYGYAGWQNLTAEVKRRLGKGVEWAAEQAQRIIHDNDVEQLEQLLAERCARSVVVQPFEIIDAQRFKTIASIPNGTENR